MIRLKDFNNYKHKNEDFNYEFMDFENEKELDLIKTLISKYIKYSNQSYLDINKIYDNKIYLTIEDDEYNLISYNNLENMEDEENYYNIEGLTSEDIILKEIDKGQENHFEISYERIKDSNVFHILLSILKQAIQKNKIPVLSDYLSPLF